MAHWSGARSRGASSSIVRPRGVIMGLPERAGLTRGNLSATDIYRPESRPRSLKARGFLLAARVQPQIGQVVTRRDHPIAPPGPAVAGFFIWSNHDPRRA